MLGPPANEDTMLAVISNTMGLLSLKPNKDIAKATETADVFRWAIEGGSVWVAMVSLPVGLAEVVSGLIHEGRYMDALYLAEQKGRIL